MVTEYEIERCAYCFWPGQACVACESLGYVLVEQPARECPDCRGMGRLGHPVPSWGYRCPQCLGCGWKGVVSGPAYSHTSKGTMEFVDEDTLASWLTREIQKHHGCDRCEIVKVYKRQDAEDSERNWRVGIFVSHNPDQEACRKNLNHVQDSAAEQFKLA